MFERKVANRGDRALILCTGPDREREMSAMVLALTRVVAGEVPDEAEGSCSLSSGVQGLKRSHGDSLAEPHLMLHTAPGRGSSIEATRGSHWII